ncbi:MAG: hypothetical protein IH948_07570 [Bacteroidetes bacterium]|nr:hypothetical protein [Bacteroidota bacterium]
MIGKYFNPSLSFPAEMTPEEREAKNVVIVIEIRENQKTSSGDNSDEHLF